MPEGIFWAKESPSAPLLTPQKVGVLRKVSKKRVKKLTDIIFLKEWMKALSVSFHLTPVLTQYLLRFGNGMHLSKKSRYKTNHLLEKSILSIADLISSFKRQASILISYVTFELWDKEPWKKLRCQFQCQCCSGGEWKGFGGDFEILGTWCVEMKYLSACCCT